jgi:hypothetical protein
MIVYNITNKVHPAIEAGWVQWQKEEHIPEVMSSGQFSDYKFYRLLEQDESDGVTYIVQYFTSDIHHYNKYIDSFASALRQKALDKWGNKFIAFRTLMQVVN